MIGTAVLVAIALAGTSGGLWFYFDEWDVIRNRSLDIESMVRPHNEHFSAALLAVHRGLIELVGIGSYLPFLIALWATHLFAAATVYVLLSEDGSPWQAAAGAIIMVVPGGGAQNLLTAFQIGFVGATALGCLALAVCLRRPALAAILLTIAVATQGVGLFYLVATGVRLVGRRSLIWLAVPTLVYGAWFVAYGAAALDRHGPGDPGAVPAYVAYGITAAFGQGFPVVGAVVLAMVALTIRRRITDRLVLASSAALLSMYVTTGLVRAQFGPEQATASRYISVALPLVLVVVMAAWRSACERYPIRHMGQPSVAVAVAVGLVAFAAFRLGWPDLQAADPLR